MRFSVLAIAVFFILGTIFLLLTMRFQNNSNPGLKKMSVV
jgi:hypothetical protein